jgi:hypothetical protein
MGGGGKDVATCEQRLECGHSQSSSQDHASKAGLKVLCQCT